MSSLNFDSDDRHYQLLGPEAPALPLDVSQGGLKAHSDDPNSLPLRERCRLAWCAKSYRCGFHWCTALWLLVLAIVGVVLGVAPIMVQHIVGKSTLSFAVANISNIADHTFVISAYGQIGNAGSQSARLEGGDMTLSYQGTAMASMVMAPIQIDTTKTTQFYVRSLVTVTDMDQFAMFNTDLVTSDSVHWTISGSTVVTVKLALGLALTVSDIKLNKDVKLMGARGFEQPVITSLDLSQSNSTAAIARITTKFFNPATFNVLGLGDLALGMQYRGAPVGVVYATDVSLLQGWNTLHLVGAMRSDIPRSEASAIIQAYLGGQPVNVSAHGVPYYKTPVLFQSAMEAVNLTVTMPAWPEPLLQSIDITGMEVTPIYDQSAALGASLLPTAVQLDMNSTLRIATPLGPNSPLAVDSVAMSAALITPVGTVGEVVTAPAKPSRVSAVQQPAAAEQASVTIITLDLQTSGTLDLTNGEQPLNEFFAGFAQADQVNLTLAGSNRSALKVEVDSVLASGLSMELPLPAISTQVQGLGGLSGTQVLSFAITGVPAGRPHSMAAQLQVLMHNPSPATVQLGRQLHLRLLVPPGTADGQQNSDAPLSAWIEAGNATAHNLTLRPGDNTVQLEAELWQLTNDDMRLSADALFSQYMSGNTPWTAAQGVSVDMANGDPTPAWMTAAVQALTMRTQLPKPPMDNLLADCDLEAMLLSFTAKGATPYSPLLTVNMSAAVQLPFDPRHVPTTLGDVNMTITMLSSINKPMGHFSLSQQGILFAPLPAGAPWSPGAPSGNISMHLSPASLIITNQTAFKQLIRQSVYSVEFPVSMVSSLSEVIELPIGTVRLMHIPVTMQLTVAGMQGLISPPILMSQPVLMEGKPNFLKFFSNLTIHNPSPIGAEFGAAMIPMSYLGFPVGNASLPSLSVKPGPSSTVTPAFGFMTRPANPAENPAQATGVRLAGSAHLRGEDVPLKFHPQAWSMEDSPLLGAALAGKTLPSIFPGTPAKLVEGSTAYLTKSFTLNASILANNIFSKEFVISNAALNVSLCADQDKGNATCHGEVYDTMIGFFTPYNLTANPIVLPPYFRGNTTPVPMQSYLSWAEMWDLIKDLDKDGGVLSTKVNGTFIASLQEFTQVFDYWCTDVPLSVKF